MLGFKKNIVTAISSSGVKLSVEDVNKIAEQVDILFDKSVPNSLYNYIAYKERARFISHMKSINDEYYEEHLKL